MALTYTQTSQNSATGYAINCPGNGAMIGPLLSPSEPRPIQVVITTPIFDAFWWYRQPADAVAHVFLRRHRMLGAKTVEEGEDGKVKGDASAFAHAASPRTGETGRVAAALWTRGRA